MTQPELQPQRDEIVDALAAMELSDDPVDEWTSTTGIKFKLKRPTQPLLQRAAASIDKPQVPVIVIDEETGKTEENPDDPDYRTALIQWSVDTTEAVMIAAIVYGLEVVELPEGMIPVDDDAWIDKVEETLEASGLAPVQIERKLRGKRFYQWLMFYAIDDESDLFAIARILTARVMLTEKEVHQMVGTFRYMAIRYPDRIGSVTEWFDSDADTFAALAAGDSLGI